VYTSRSTNSEFSEQKMESKSSTPVLETNTAKIELELDGSEREVNQYRIGSKIGVGSFAEVRLGTNKFTGEEYAIKILSRSFLKKQREFIRTGRGRPKIKTALEDVEREIAFMKKIRHKNVVSLIEVIDDAAGDSIFMVLEYLPLGQVMNWDNNEKAYKDKSGKVLDDSRSKQVLIDVIRGLSYIHSNHLVHRDLKPENILIGSHGEAKITDFGVAQKVYFNESEKGELNKTAGTPWFLAPEVIKQKTFNGFAVDLWALGVCLLIFVTGKVPFFSEDMEKLYSMITDDPVTIPKNLSADVTRVLKALLEKDVGKRWTLDLLKKDSWININNEVCEIIEVSASELQTAITVRINFFMAVKLKMFVRRWRARSQASKIKRMNSSLGDGGAENGSLSASSVVEEKSSSPSKENGITNAHLPETLVLEDQQKRTTEAADEITKPENIEASKAKKKNCCRIT